MGGELDCFSVPGRGSRFWLALPLGPAEAPPPPLAIAEAATEPMERRLRVLLADDHPVNRRVVELILDGSEVDLVQVENGAAAVKAFSAGSFDLVLMDMQMPVMDGLSATRAIRERERSLALPRTPIVMLTANAGQDHVRAEVRSGRGRPSLEAGHGAGDPGRPGERRRRAGPGRRRASPRSGNRARGPGSGRTGQLELFLAGALPHRQTGPLWREALAGLRPMLYMRRA